ncbi:hypothetical protein ASPCAL04013 [Aspergillus calidoustus]|uniref:Uncharacterized protein n=1 Tax=Aspergillus calidoustus TaxID=454130 RepID=A0A0U5FTG1_ASPCI|nr:hypothetical protein ASPCAL04013 [Aspergillus calidoustus]
MPMDIPIPTQLRGPTMPIQDAQDTTTSTATTATFSSKHPLQTLILADIAMDMDTGVKDDVADNTTMEGAAPRLSTSPVMTVNVGTSARN